MADTRCSAAEVKAILSFTPSKSDLQPYINAAEELVTELCGSLSYTANRLKQIETWLSAHFLAVSDSAYAESQIALEDIGEQQTQYQRLNPGKFGSTVYGQQAMMLDTLGGLAYIANHPSQGKRAKVGITYLGTCPRRQTDRGWLFYGLYGPL